MFKSMAAVAAASVLAVCASSSMAQEPIDRTNQWEVTLIGSGSNDVDFDAGSVSVNVALGYYFTPQLEGIIRQTVSFADGGDGSSWNAGTRVGIQYNFDFEQDTPIIPYVGANIGYLYGDDVEETFIAGPEAGLKWYVNDTTFIYGSVAYDFFFEDGDDAEDTFEDGQFVYSLGIGFRF